MEETLLLNLLESYPKMAQMTDLRPLMKYALETIFAFTAAEKGYILVYRERSSIEECVGLCRDGSEYSPSGVGGPETARSEPISSRNNKNGLHDPLICHGQVILPIEGETSRCGWLCLEKTSGDFQPEEMDIIHGYIQAFAGTADKIRRLDGLQEAVKGRLTELENVIMDRQVTESALARRAEQMETLYRIGMAITSGLDLNEVLWELYRQCKQVVQIDVFYVALYNASNGILTFPLFLDKEQPISIAPRQLKTVPSLTGYVVETQKTFYSPDTTSENAELPVKLIIRRGGEATRSFLGIPLIWHDHIIGILSVQSYQVNAYTPEYIRLMETISTQAAGALEHARLYAEVSAARESAEKANRGLQKALADMEVLATTDKLTGAYNRRKFDQIIEVEIKRARRYNSPLSLLLLDIDYFKKLNDIYGHHVGDQVLRSFSRLIKSNIRTTDTFTRWGGDEIIILTPGIDLQQATLLAEKLRMLVENQRFASLQDTRVTMSIGVAQYLTGESGDDLLHRADAALYRAKGNGRNCVIESEIT